MTHIRSLFHWLAGVMIFLASALVLTPCLYLLPRQRTFALARFLFSILLRTMGVKLRVEGREKVDPNTSYLIMGNHQSLFDLFMIPVAIPLCFTGVEAAYHFSVPVWGFLIKKWGCIPIERHNLEKAKQSIELARQTLKKGVSIAIYPEGHRTRTGKIQPFKKGPFHLAKAARPHILPFGVRGLFEFQARGTFLLSPGEVRVHIGEPIPASEYAHMDVEEIRDLVYTRIKDLT